MKKVFVMAMLSLAAATGSAYAQTATPAKPTAEPVAPAANSQQNKMTECNAKATGKKGDDRKTFMSQCLSAKKLTPQQEKMASCNKEATGKKGDDRKAFMSQCLKAG